MDAGFALLLPWLPVPASFVSFCGPSHGRPASGYHHCLLLTSTSGSILSRGHLAHSSLHCTPSKARSKFPFKKRKKEKRRANRARPRPAGRTTTNTRTGRHSTSAQTHPARPPLCTPNNTEFWAEQESKVNFARLGWEHKGLNSGHVSRQIRSVIGMAGILH